MVELNPFLQPIGSPLANRSFTSGYQFDSNNERSSVTGMFIRDASISNAKIGTAAIGTANIGTLTFNEISGGTATFGGTTNGNGLVEVLNDAGGTVVQLNKAGLTVTNGSISLQNDSGSVSIDNKGVISAQNFSFSSVTDTNTFSVGATTSFNDIPNMSMTFSLNRASRVLFIATVSGGNTSDSGNGVIARMLLNGSSIGGLMLTPGHEHAGGVLYNTASTQVIQSVASGSGTIKLQAAALSGGSGNISSNEKFLGYIVLGK